MVRISDTYWGREILPHPVYEILPDGSLFYEPCHLYSVAYHTLLPWRFIDLNVCWFHDGRRALFVCPLVRGQWAVRRLGQTRVRSGWAMWGYTKDMVNKQLELIYRGNLSLRYNRPVINAFTWFCGSSSCCTIVGPSAYDTWDNPWAPHTYIHTSSCCC